MNLGVYPVRNPMIVRSQQNGDLGKEISPLRVQPIGRQRASYAVLEGVESLPSVSIALHVGIGLANKTRVLGMKSKRRKKT